MVPLQDGTTTEPSLMLSLHSFAGGVSIMDISAGRAGIEVVAMPAVSSGRVSF